MRMWKIIITTAREVAAGTGVIESVSALNDISSRWELFSRLLSSQVNNKLITC